MQKDKDRLKLVGSTELIVEVKRIVEPESRVELVTLQGDTLHCEITKAIGDQLNGQLHKLVRLRGTAEWDFETLALIGFKIDAVLPFHPVSPRAAFAALREEFGVYFDQIDNPEAWVYQERHS